MSGETILIVEDNPLSQKLIRALLERAGYDVCTAQDGEQAWVVLQSFDPKLILMDIQLPGVDGLELTRQLKADPQRRHIPVVAVTSCTLHGDEEKARHAGCDGYVSKATDMCALPALVQTYLASRTN